MRYEYHCEKYNVTLTTDHSISRDAFTTLGELRKYMESNGEWDSEKYAELTDDDAPVSRQLSGGSGFVFAF